MEIKITKYEKPVTVEGEFERLKELSELVNNDNVQIIKENINSHRKKRKSGIYSGIESDIAGFYELEQTTTRSWVLCSKFRNLKRTRVKELLINRINSVNEGTIELPERLFEVKTIRIEIEGRLIDVEEVCRQAWDYILYKSVYYADEYYVDIVFEQSAASWSRDFKLTDAEAQIVSHGTEEEITDMVHRKRNENRS